MTQHPFVSVVTPVYNGERFLSQCIESVLAQTYQNWDYTIVNNCSTDRTLEIAQAFASRDPRIRVYTNDAFVPVIANYNKAFRRIAPQSKYCKLVAADDWLSPDCLEKMVGLAEQHPSVAIVGTFALAESTVMWQGLPLMDAVIRGTEVCRRWLLGGPYVFGTASSELFRADIVRSRPAFYNESNFHADTEVCLDFLRENDFGFVHEVLVFQGTQKESLTSFSQRMNTYLPHRLYCLIKYGDHYLAENELTARIRQVLKSYYEYLASQAFRRPEHEFWDYHRKKLAEVGHPLSTMRLAGATAIVGLKKLSPGLAAKAVKWPLRTLRRFVRR